MLKFWITELMLDSSIIGQQQQPFTILIQSPNGINFWNRNIVFKGLAIDAFWSKLTEDAVGFVKKNMAIGHE